MVRKSEEKWEPLDSLGVSGETVAKNIRRMRLERGLAFTEVAERLQLLGRDIPTWGLRKIESGGRRVDVDDLVSIAVVLRTSPTSLLMPGIDQVGPTDRVAIMNTGPAPEANDVWHWLTAERFIDPAVGYLEFGSRSWPRWVLAEVEKMVGRTPEERAQIRKDVAEDLGMS